MIFQLASIWLVICILFCVFAWLTGRRWIAFALPFIVPLVAFAMWMPTGSPRFTHPPPGKFDVLWADIKVDEAIYALLKQGDGPAIFYVLPYSTSEANDLQGAIDEGGPGGKVKLKIHDNGGESYEGEPPVTGNPPKE